MRVLVCGGRDYEDSSAVFSTLDRISPDVVIHGAHWSGADKLADDWATSRRVACIRVPAKWATYGGKAGPMRNQRMLDEFKPNLVVAFPGGPGTADMVRRARKAGVRVNDKGNTLPDGTL